MRRIDGDENRHDPGGVRAQQGPCLRDCREGRRADIGAGRIAEINELEASLEILAAATVSGVVGQGKGTADRLGADLRRRGAMQDKEEQAAQKDDPAQRQARQDHRPSAARPCSGRSSSAGPCLTRVAHGVEHSMTDLPGGNAQLSGVTSFRSTKYKSSPIIGEPSYVI